MDDLITVDELVQLRKSRYRQTDGERIRTEEDALAFINDLGFCWLINLSDGDLPSLHYACLDKYVKVGRPYAGQYAKTWWDSKQTLSGRKACYYAKLLRGRGTFVSWGCFPFLYAVYANRGDYRDDYRNGLLSPEDKRVMDLITAFPEIPSPELRKRFGPVGKPVTRALDRSLQNLQETFRITVAGGSLEGWTIHNWALLEDWVAQELIETGRNMDPDYAKQEIIVRYISMAVAASAGDIAWVFRWNRREVASIINRLVGASRTREIEVAGLPGAMFISE